MKERKENSSKESKESEWKERRKWIKGKNTSI
jgi:hypothetical protein